jgi:micrococcal nuclease
MKRSIYILCGIVATIILVGAYSIGDESPKPTNGTTPSTTSNTVEQTYQPIVQPKIEDPQWYRVLYVVDGDTLSISKDGVDTRVRLIGIDTPEIEGRYTTQECFGNEASAFAQKMLENELVRIETDQTQALYDAYDRLLAYVFLQDNTFVNYEMIAQGYAYEYTYRNPYAYQALFKQAEQTARENEFGLWKKEVCQSYEQ